ncbi:gamma-aminobutyric acid receptor subunit beta-like [Glossina fuscipes]|uniref:Gamma-aminobutyric acid receptor subunit beta-like n=1 Tax=Glossina fuscipes TaxID=7396 RepID=A0A8U0W8P7_9MUSC|nr:gamma-aminobutyric acid receptor subunit beta-like [Glossina fuscipes]
MSDSTLYHHYKTLMPKASLASLWLAFNIALLLQEPSKHIATVQAATAGGSMLGDVNISAILDSFSVSYDKRVRPNYGGKSNNLL